MRKTNRNAADTLLKDQMSISLITTQQCKGCQDRKIIFMYPVTDGTSLFIIIVHCVCVRNFAYNEFTCLKSLNLLRWSVCSWAYTELSLLCVNRGTTSCLCVDTAVLIWDLVNHWPQQLRHRGPNVTVGQVRPLAGRQRSWVGPGVSVLGVRDWSEPRWVDSLVLPGLPSIKL